MYSSANRFGIENLHRQRQRIWRQPTLVAFLNSQYFRRLRMLWWRLSYRAQHDKCTLCYQSRQRGMENQFRFTLKHRLSFYQLTVDWRRLFLYSHIRGVGWMWAEYANSKSQREMVCVFRSQVSIEFLLTTKLCVSSIDSASIECF